MTCPACTTELSMDGTCPMCIEYAKPPMAEGYVMDMTQLTDNERELLRRVEDTK